MEEDEEREAKESLELIKLIIKSVLYLAVIILVGTVIFKLVGG